MRAVVYSRGPVFYKQERVALRKREIPHYSLRHIVKPGLTGWALESSFLTPEGRRMSRYVLWFDPPET